MDIWWPLRRHCVNNQDDPLEDTGNKTMGVVLGDLFNIMPCET